MIQQFNLALAFPLPPSLLTNPTSSRVSVNPPSTDPELEREGQAALARLRLEIEELLDAGVPERARERVEELREACRIWKGTGEEEARGKWVDGLELLVEERAGGWKGEGGGQMKREGSAVRGIKVAEASSGGGPGFLRRLRDEIYME